MLGRIISFVFWKNWEYQKVILKLTDLYDIGLLYYHRRLRFENDQRDVGKRLNNDLSFTDNNNYWSQLLQYLGLHCQHWENIPTHSDFVQSSNLYYLSIKPLVKNACKKVNNRANSVHFYPCCRTYCAKAWLR